MPVAHTKNIAFAMFLFFQIIFQNFSSFKFSQSIDIKHFYHNNSYTFYHFHMKIFLLYYLYYKYSCILVVLWIIAIYTYFIICTIFIYRTNFLQTKCKQRLHSFLVYIIKMPRRQRT